MRILGYRWLGRLRRVNRQYFDCLATVRALPDGTQAGDVDNKGVVSLTPVVVASNVPCRAARWDAQPTQSVIGDRVEAGSRWTVTFDAGERRVKAGHLLSVSGFTDHEPWVRTFKVIGPLDPSSFEIMSQVLCHESSF